MKIKYIFFACAALLVMSSCSDSKSVTNTLTLSTPTVASITSTTAYVSETASGEADIVKIGFCVGKTADVNIDSTTFEGSYTANISSLTPNTQYYLKAFALVYNQAPIYSEAVQFKTSANSAEEQLADYVAPTYQDDYTSFSSWSNRSQWNLANVHDPSVVRADDGYYYMYQTDASYGNAHSGHGHFFCRRSKDLVNWEFMGSTMSTLPTWIKTKLNEIRTAAGLSESSVDFTNQNNFGFSSPCVRKVQSGLYRMYYSITVPGYINGDNSWGERSFIGMMESSDPSNINGWVDKGYVITNSSDKGLNFNVDPTDYANCYFKFNAIDPSFIITENGEHWLIYGSWNSGIAAVQLDPTTGKTLSTLGNPWGDISAYGKLIYTRKMNNRWQASEGPEVDYHNGYYYLFLAYDALDIPCNTRVVRSKNINGPYVGIDGTDVTNTGGEAYPIVTHPYKFSNSDGWVGVSHCAIFDDGNGNWFYSSQGRFPENVSGINSSNAIMMGQVRSLHWTSSGWPVVMPERYGAVPKAAIKDSDIVGTWEHIDLGYSKGNQKSSTEMVFGSNHKITSGAWQGAAWSFDASTNTLTANGIELILQREVDWEASPRKATIVYAGINGKKTYWGKKVK